jgi:hypothetical protein
MQTLLESLYGKNPRDGGPVNQKALERYLEANEIAYTNRAKITRLTDLIFQDLAKNNPLEGKDGEILLIEFKKLVESQTENINQRAKRFGQVRKILVDRFGTNSDIVKFSYTQSITREQSKVIHNAKDDLASDRRRDRIQVDEVALKNLMNACVSSKDFYDHVICVMLASGSRMIEVLNKNVSVFTALPDNTKINIDGLAKTKLERSIVRPLLWIASDVFLKVLGQVRDQMDEGTGGAISRLSNEEISRVVELPLNRRIKSWDVGFPSSHGLRKSYVALLYNNLSKEERSKISYAQFTADTLGQFNLKHALAYTNFNIILEEAPAEEEEKKDEVPIVTEEKKTSVVLLNRKKEEVVVPNLISILTQTCNTLHSLDIKITAPVLMKLGFNTGILNSKIYKDLRDALNALEASKQA